MVEREQQAPRQIVRTEELCRSYHLGGEEIHAVDGLSLAIPRGAYVAFHGRSGSGKTTLLNLMGGLDRPTRGSVYLEGRRLAELSERELTELRRSTVGFVFQSFALLPTFSAYENVELPLRLAHVDPGQRQRRARDCLRMVELETRRDHRPYELSGGQQQRVAIARALANSPSLILADEPTGELDSQTGRRIFALFQRIAGEQGVTVVVATHDPAIEEYASAVYRLRDGRIVP
jgi:ABC-type lipoprotein export system ATPase subunit